MGSNEHAELLNAMITVPIEGREIRVRAWKYDIPGQGGHLVPVLLLDTDCPENAEWDRKLTDSLHGGDEYYRLCQEIVLGIGGVRMLRALGHTALTTFHMNEGHSSLLTLALLEERLGHSDLAKANEADIREVQKKCVFTTAGTCGTRSVFAGSGSAHAGDKSPGSPRCDAVLP